MKIIAFVVRDDELEAFDKFSKEFDIQVVLKKEILTLENIDSIKGYDGVSITGKCKLNKEILDKFIEYEIKFITTRTVGYDNVDIDYAKKLGIKFSNVSYSPDSVGEFTVMSILSLLKKLPYSRTKMDSNNFTLSGLQGKELKSQTVGIIGTGKIGQSVIRSLSGFRCKIIGYDPYPCEDMKDLIDYVSYDELISNSDVISLHLPLTKDNYHMFNKEAFEKMKDEVLIINNARGDLVNTKDLIWALENNVISGAAVDVIEYETEFFRRDFSSKELSHEELKKLKEMPNVQVTAHHAFFTKEVVSDIVEGSLKNLKSLHTTGISENAVC
ncbi:D-isomer specific 2-hydroxyacid dehydrogenase family protein [uncultured Ilyobacter sp.]|jgi:D-lactate dehydrogenase|uniref:D-isomer specific 2-hydroxyacid dehydrogenase family protein n=1 Tax=uncultured Ilyobacter sp. TaxID=544433 RepID=UPI0029C0DE84|nr:D-isomer specific 2-hydroxyacid dehydrogenase family protein [uncultured Ilyobacter sp.]